MPKWASIAEPEKYQIIQLNSYHAYFPFIFWLQFTSLNEGEISKFKSVSIKSHNVLSYANSNLYYLEPEE